MPTFSGRVEARLTIPTGGAAVSASNSGGGATTVTTPAGNYYLTSAGGVSGLVADFQTQLNTSRAPSSGSWTVTYSTTTGLISIACTGTSAIPSFSLDWTSTALRDVLGFQYNINYPTDATELGRQIGYGAWTSGSGWSCNESSGSLAPTFGAVTLSAVSTPTYSNQGPRGGADKAVGFDSASDAFSGGDVFDPLAQDLAIAFVGKISATTNVDLFGKGWTASNGFAIVNEAAAGLRIYITDGVNSANTNAASLPANQWFVAIVVIDRTANVIRCGWQSLSTGTQTVSSTASISSVGSMNSVGNFTMGASGAYGSGAGTFQCAAAYVVQGASVANFSSSLSAALTNFAAAFSTWTGTQQARGVWFPDCPINLDGDPKRAPLVSDARSSKSPTGQLVTLVGNTFYRHRNVRWSHVPKAQVWDTEATYENGSWEEFFTETQLGLGSSWFTPGSLVQIYYSNAGTDALLGADATIPGWSIVGVSSIEPKKSEGDWTGLWRIELPTIIAAGS